MEKKKIYRQSTETEIQMTHKHVMSASLIKEKHRDIPGGSVVKNPPANAGDTRLIPGPGRSHMLWSN